MASDYPTSIQTLSGTRGSASSKLNAPSHVDHHIVEDDTVEALQAKVGANSSAVTTSHDYKLSNVATGDKAVSLTGTESLTNKTLGAGTKVAVGSDATGDVYNRGAGGGLERIAVGSENDIFTISSGLPAWISNPATTDTSYADKGVIQLLTDAATSGLSVASGVVNVNSGTGANQIVKLNASSQLPAVSGALLTDLVSPTVYKNGVTSRDTATTGDQVIAHGLGTTPKRTRISAFVYSSGTFTATGSYNGTTTSGIGTGTAGATSSGTYIIYFNGISGNNANKAYASIAVDSTNITLTWGKDSSPTDTAKIIWEVEA